MRPGTTSTLRLIRLKQQHGVWHYLRLAAMVAVVFLTASAAAMQSQTKPPAPGQRKAAAAPAKTRQAPERLAEPDLSWLQDMLKDQALMADLSTLGEKLKDGIQYPTARRHSAILPRLPESTLFYVAIPQLWRDAASGTGDLPAATACQRSDARFPEEEQAGCGGTQD